MVLPAASRPTKVRKRDDVTQLVIPPHRYLPISILMFFLPTNLFQRLEIVSPMFVCLERRALIGSLYKTIRLSSLGWVETLIDQSCRGNDCTRSRKQSPETHRQRYVASSTVDNATYTY